MLGHRKYGLNSKNSNELMLIFNLAFVLKALCFACWGIIISKWVPYIIKEELKKHPIVDMMFYEIPNPFLRNLCLYTFFLIVTIVCSALPCVFILNYFLNAWIITSVLSIPFVLFTIYKEIENSKNKEV